jgi:hypothetical protein
MVVPTILVTYAPTGENAAQMLSPSEMLEAEATVIFAWLIVVFAVVVVAVAYTG